ncbi:MAG: hypothetical protein Q9171_004806 [Xanthocarpia ochracea]
MPPTTRHDDDACSFAKLKGPENYELWSNNMAGALGSSGHQVFIDDPASRREPPALKSTDDDDNERIQLIWQRDERRAKHFSDADSEVKANALLSRCTDLVGKLATHKMTIEEIITIIVLNQLPSQFHTIKEIKRNDLSSTRLWRSSRTI